MKSMTGYGRATGEIGGYTLTAQVSSVNRKTLDLAIRLPQEWDSLESMVGEQVRKAASRGRVSVVIELTGTRRAGEIVWNETEVNAAIDRLAVLAKARGIAFEPTPELLWSIANSQRLAAELPPIEAASPVVAEAVA